MKLLPLLILPCWVLAASAQDVTLFASDFEQDDGGLTLVGGNDWEHGFPTAGPGVAHSGLLCWGTNLDGPVTAPSRDTLALPTLDPTVAPDADALVVRWWQWFDEPPLITFPYHVTRVRASSGGHSQEVFGRVYFWWSTQLPHPGWREVVAVLGEEYLGGPLDLSFEHEASGTEGMYLDDVSVTAVALTEVSREDFESGPGGFRSAGWSHGPITACPIPVTVPSGVHVWATAPGGCGYFDGRTLLSPPIDLTPYAGLEVFLRWSRYAALEKVWDGVEHEVRYDGGPWEVGAGYHDFAYGPGLFTYTTYGVGVDPERGATVQHRWRVHADTEEFYDGMWIDDFAVAVREVIPGSGSNPAGSLTVSAGDFTIGTTVRLAVVDPAGAFGSPAISALAVALAGNPALPSGTPIPGWGLTPGASGDLLIDLDAVIALVTGTPWSPGVPGQVDLGIPGQPALVGLPLFLQAALVDLAGADVGLTNGLFEVPSP